jgi:hypothetical protein
VCNARAHQPHDWRGVIERSLKPLLEGIREADNLDES